MSDKVITYEEYQARKVISKAAKGKVTPTPNKGPEPMDSDFYVASVAKVKPKKEPKYYDFEAQGTSSKKTNNTYGYGSYNDFDRGYAKTPVYTARCYTTHKPLRIITPTDGKEYLIYGGSCSDPVVKDADIYVGFEYGMKSSTNAYPWSGGASFTFHIQDGSVPSSLEDAKKLISYLAENLIAGKKVHIGCIGGHGRTGTILAALVTYMTGNKNSIEYVRTHYCQKAVESITQINWLNKHFDIEKAKPSKDYSAIGTSTKAWGSTPAGKGSGVSKNYSQLQASKEVGSTGYTLFETVKPVRVKGSIWGF